MKTDVESIFKHTILLTIFKIGFVSNVQADGIEDHPACWAQNRQEAQLIRTTKTELSGRIATVSYSPRGPVDTPSNWGDFVDCVKIRFYKNETKYSFEVIGSSHEILSLGSLWQINKIGGLGIDIKEGLVIFYYFNPMFKSHWVDFGELENKEKDENFSFD